MSRMLVIGLDPGTATTGYGIVRENPGGSLTLVAYGVITTPANMAMPDRLAQLYAELQKILLLHRPDSAAVLADLRRRLAAP